MIKNNIKIAWRNLKKQPFFTFLNVAGLAIGLTGGLLIGLYIYDELSFDTMFADSEQIYRIDLDSKFGGKEDMLATAPAPLAATLLKNYSQVEISARFRNFGSCLLRKTDAIHNIKENNSTYADSSFLKLFGIPLLEGDAKTALEKANSLVLTKSVAEKHFGSQSALGKAILVDNEETYTVTGVIDDLPQNSFLRNHGVFFSMAGLDDAHVDVWGSNNFPTFIKLNSKTDIATFEAEIQKIVKNYIIPWAQAIFPGLTYDQFIASGNYLKFKLTPLESIHLDSDRVAEMSPNGSRQNVYILFFIGLFLITLAVVNFMNLSTAYSLKRAKEVGIRKTLGSNNVGLIKQFLTEAILMSIISLIAALFLAILALPFFNELSAKTISIPFSNPGFWAILIFSAIFLGLLSGSYPSFFLSSFSPIKVLKGSLSGVSGGKSLRNSLVIFQFSISIFLILSTLVVYRQLNFIQNKDLGFQKNQLLIVDDLGSAQQKLNSFKEQVKNIPQIEQIALSSYLPTPSSRTDYTFYQQGFPNQEDQVNMQEWSIDHEYIGTIGIELLAGRDFDFARAADSTSIILNESAIRLFKKSPEEAIGMKVVNLFGQENGEIAYTVIGVVKNFHYESLRQNINALAMRLGDYADKMIIKVRPGDFETTISQVKQVWSSIAPEQPFNYYFLDDSFNNTYQSEQRLGGIFFTFSMLSIFIACLGLFGLSAFNAEKRIKEIGIRKVMGASIGQIVVILSSDFMKLVFVSILISLPIGWYAMNKWLEDFTYRATIPWWAYALAAVLAIFVSILTVSYQSIKAALINPIKSLKSD